MNGLINVFGMRRITVPIGRESDPNRIGTPHGGPFKATADKALPPTNTTMT